MQKGIAVFLSFAISTGLAASAGAEPVFLRPFARIDDSTLYLVGAGLLLLLIALAALLQYNRHSLKKLNPANKPKQEHRRNNASLSEDGGWETLDISELTVQKNKPAANPESKGNATPGCKVRLVPADHPEDAMEFTIGANESVTLGRNERSDITLNETDTALSGLHFELHWDSRVLHLRDRNSTNGTALNRVPLRPEVWVRVENSSTIQAGANRYAVFVEKT